MSLPTNASTANYVSYRDEQLAFLTMAKQREGVESVIWAVALFVVCAGAAAVVLVTP